MKARSKAKTLDIVRVFQERGQRGQWRYRIKSCNGRKLQVSEAYHSKGNAVKAAVTHCERHCNPVGYLLRTPDKDGQIEETIYQG